MQLVSKREFTQKTKVNAYESPPLKIAKGKTKEFALSKEKLQSMHHTDKDFKTDNKGLNRESIPKFVHYDPSENQTESVRFSVREDQSSQ